MLQSKLFTKTRKEAPTDEVSKNAQFLIQGGYINKEMAGVYSLLPLGLKVVEKIRQIVSEEMEKVGSTEILMSSLQNKENWNITGRWDDDAVDIWFKTELKNGTEIGLGWSHEEPIVEMMKSHIKSYHDLPVYVHQFQNKFRNEIRAKSGIMRCREFLMKDMYSFSKTEEEHMEFYNRVIESYMRVFEKVGLKDLTYVTSASGGVFTDKFSHEFQTVSDGGEDTIYINSKTNSAINEEVWNEETLKKLEAREEDFKKEISAEVGNIFTFGTEKCEKMGLFFTEKDGSKKGVYLGSYGIGITRLMGVLVEVISNEKGIVWPETVAPYKVHLITLGIEEGVIKNAEEIYEALKGSGEIIYDDRDLRAGEKFADADFIGSPVRIISSKKNLEKGVFEVTDMKKGDVEYLTKEEIINKFGNK